jgi:chromosome segregation ATPase
VVSALFLLDFFLMRIKKVIISGFKSYKENVIFDDFSPNLNIIGF